VNGTLTKLAGGHSFKVGADYRVLGVKAKTYGNSAGSFTFSGQYTGSNATSPAVTSRNAIADLLLGYPSAGSIPINPEIDDFVNYFGAYAQDDFHVSDRLTVNYGLRLEHETGLAERNNQLAVGFDSTTVNPLNVTIPGKFSGLCPIDSSYSQRTGRYGSSNGHTNFEYKCSRFGHLFWVNEKGDIL
jgi:trimeric autotransporter adhesin